MAKKAVVVILAVIVGVLAYIYYDDVGDFMKKDSCLDTGGRWHENNQLCEIDRGGVIVFESM